MFSTARPATFPDALKFAGSSDPAKKNTPRPEVVGNFSGKSHDRFQHRRETEDYKQ